MTKEEIIAALKSRKAQWEQLYEQKKNTNIMEANNYLIMVKEYDFLLSNLK